uniref:Uncharacterized protein n=2 Tax=Spongospora subterranea TaxID=70186 RepID=A0A0H5R9H5_9EUKA|eukprot:CRZ10436.1 hypothetical protein [Spongospora subterranea]
MQGRVFSIQRATRQFSLLLASLISGPLVNRVNSLMSSPSSIQSTVDTIVGAGDERAIAVIFIILGITVSVVSVIGVMYSPFRNLESQIHDYIPANGDKTE